MLSANLLEQQIETSRHLQICHRQHRYRLSWANLPRGFKYGTGGAAPEKRRRTNRVALPL